MGNDRYPNLFLHGYTHDHRPEDHRRNGWTTSAMTTRRWTLQHMRLHNSPWTRQDGGTLYAICTCMGCQRALAVTTDNVIVARAISQIRQRRSSPIAIYYKNVGDTPRDADYHIPYSWNHRPFGLQWRQSGLFLAANE